MTIKNPGDKQLNVNENVSVWFCTGCDSYHVKAGEVVLTFESSEFSEFVSASWDCFYRNQSGVEALL